MNAEGRDRLIGMRNRLPWMVGALMVWGLAPAMVNAANADGWLADGWSHEKAAQGPGQEPVLLAQRGQDQETTIQRLEERVRRLEQEKDQQNNENPGNPLRGQVFFRGGAAFLTNDRSEEVLTDTFGLGGKNDGDTGYYVGGGVELLLSNDTWGLMEGTWALGEIGVEFKRFNSREVLQPTSALLGGSETRKVQLTMLTVNVAPKIMFFEGSRLRPWIIPVGLDFHVISPPSNDVTVLDIGGQAGAGLQYNIWKAFNVGIDGRFHLTSNQTDTVNNFGTIGGYVGIGF